MSETTTLAGETYRGHEIAVTETHYEASKYGERPAFTQRTAQHNGREFRCPSGDVAEVMRKLRAHVDESIADAEILPELTRLVAAVAALAAGARILYRSTVSVGDVVWVFAMGRHRRGLVTKVGRTRVEVAYTTASSGGRVYRKSVPMTAAWVTS